MAQDDARAICRIATRSQEGEEIGIKSEMAETRSPTLRVTRSLGRTRPVRSAQGDSLPNLLGSESISHWGEEVAERRARGDVTLFVGVLNELFKHDLILRR